MTGSPQGETGTIPLFASVFREQRKTSINPTRCAQPMADAFPLPSKVGLSLPSKSSLARLSSDQQQRGPCAVTVGENRWESVARLRDRRGRVVKLTNIRERCIERGGCSRIAVRVHRDDGHDDDEMHFRCAPPTGAHHRRWLPAGARFVFDERFGRRDSLAIPLHVG